MSPTLQRAGSSLKHEPEINFPPLNMLLSSTLSQQQEKSPVQQESTRKYFNWLLKRKGTFGLQNDSMH